jgi:phospholipase C
VNVPNIAPGEEFAQVTTQLFGTEKPDATAMPTMKGYVRDYTNLLRKHGYKEDEVKRYAQQVMQSHTPEQLPVLNGLAKHYAVCDMWFSSVPSQTNTNRAFAFCGTSMGLTDNGFLEEDKRAPVIEKIVGYKLGDDRFKAKTIFNALADDGKTTWKVFRESGMCCKATLIKWLKSSFALSMSSWLRTHCYYQRG